MSPSSLLVNSPDPALAEFLERELDPARYRVLVARPGPDFVETVRRGRPQIAVLDRVHERPNVVQIEIAVLRDARPDVRIVALSSESSPKDADIVERGIFYYMTLPAGPELIRVIEAAARGSGGGSSERNAPPTPSRDPTNKPATPPEGRTDPRASSPSGRTQSKPNAGSGGLRK